MKLRAKLAITTLVAAVPVIAALAFGYRQLTTDGFDELVGALMLERLGRAPGQACLEARGTENNPTFVLHPPATRPPWAGGVGTEVEVHLLDANGESVTVGAPRLPAGVEARLPSTSERQAWYPQDAEGGRLVMVRLPESARPCAYAVVRVPQVRRSPPPPVVAIPLLVAVAAVLVGVGPMVRRTTSLTRRIHRWREDGDQIPEPDPGKDELGELSRAFAEAARRLQQQHAELESGQRELREFVENVTHDLATPLSVLHGHLSALATNPEPEVARQAMNEADYMAGILANLAATAKLGASTLELAAVDLVPLVARVVDRLAPLAERLSVALDFAVPAYPVVVRADVVMAERLITNLVANGVRHNDAGGHVAVLLDVQGVGFQIEIKDDGPGLAAPDAERVLRRGVRGAARTRGPDGSGLGLAIAQRVADAHRWSLVLEPNEPCGLIARIEGIREQADTDGRLLDS